VRVFAEEGLAVVAAEEEGEAVQVGAECVEAVGGVADVGQERWGERGGVGAPNVPSGRPESRPALSRRPRRTAVLALWCWMIGSVITWPPEFARRADSALSSPR